MKNRRRSVLITLIAMASFSVEGLGAVPASPQCDGRDVTMLGSNGADVLVGTRDADVISGLGGADLLRGLAGDDHLCGDRGSDRVEGGRHDDILRGGLGAHDAALYRGGEGPANVYLQRRGCDCGVAKTPGLARDELRGLEQILGQRNFGDMLHGDEKDNVLRGRGGDDLLQARAGHDHLRGGAGEDEGDGGRGKDHCLHVEDATNC